MVECSRVQSKVKVEFKCSNGRVQQSQVQPLQSALQSQEEPSRPMHGRAMADGSRVKTLLCNTLTWVDIALLRYTIWLYLHDSTILYHGSTWFYWTLQHSIPWLYLSLMDHTMALFGSTGLAPTILDWYGHCLPVLFNCACARTTLHGL